MRESWAKVPGHPYEVSDTGLVRRTETAYTHNGGYCITAGSLLSGGRHTNGYVVVGAPGLYVHRLVAQAFVPNPHGRPNVNHIDGDPANNCAANLEWVTQAENLRHAREVLGRGAPPPLHYGEAQHCAKLTEDDVIEMRRLWASGTTAAALGRRFGVSKTTAHRAVTGKTWRHIAMPANRPPPAA